MQDMDRRDFETRHEAGLKTRREVIGTQRTDQGMAAVDDFSRPLADLLNTYCFNDIWNRPGLPRAIRSMLCIAMLSAQNRTPELKAHLNAALNNGVTRDQIQEVLLQVGIYCGVPAAVEGFRQAREVFEQRDR